MSAVLPRPVDSSPAASAPREPQGPGSSQSAHDAVPVDEVTREPIAIIGYGCVLPDAPDVEAFRRNLMEGKSSIREVPAERWPADLYWSADRSEPDKTYAKIGAFVFDDAFNGLDYRMPPKVVEQVDPSQRWALAATRQAFQDAGYATGLKGDVGKEFDRERCAVIIGNAMGGESNKTAAKRMFWPEARAAIEADADFQALPDQTRAALMQRAETRYKANTPPVNEDTMPGHLSNVVAGRIANVFDLSGKNFTTDAACASSLAALDAAVDTLRKQEAEIVVWGGTDRSMDITPYIEFSKIGALSPDGSRPFDKDANGFVMGEGCAMFLLKRLRDAERDGDRIHAVVRGIGSSSDGKGKGITAPNPLGQVKAVRRAYADAECGLSTIGYLEAHGTSTPVGDPVELQSVFEAAKQAGSPPPVGSILVGSVKSNIGHLKAGAGAAGVLKAVIAVEEGVIPPSINVRELNPRIDWANSPFRVATTRAEWPQPPHHPRRAAVSSFGFGGTNFHVVLEQYVPGAIRKKETDTVTMTQAGSPGFDEQGFRAHMQVAVGLENEPLVIDANAAPQIVAALPSSIEYPDSGQGPRIRDVFDPITRAGVMADLRVAVAPAGLDEVPKKMELAQKAASNPAAARLAFNQGVFIGKGPVQGKVAFLFPGQGTQYVNMMRDLSAKYEVVRNTFNEADDVLVDDLGGVRLTDILWPDPDTPEARKSAEEKLKLTEFTQPAVLAADIAVLRLMKQWGVSPDVVAGHSLGEYGALVAAGVLSFADALHAVAARGREMAHVDVPDLGKMAAVPADWETVQQAIAGVEGYVIPANKNCPSQTVLAGSSAGVDAAVKALEAKGLQAQYLPVSAAFHSDIVAPASQPLRNVLARLDVQAPKVRCLSNVGAQPYGDDPEQIRDNLAVQVANPVEWIDIIQRMYDEGVRVFIEVGPKQALTGFARDILKDKKDAIAIASNHPKKGGIQHINELFAFLGAWGFRPQLPDPNDPTVYTAAFRDPTAAFRTRAAPGTPAAAADPRIDVIADALASLSRQLETLRGATPAMGATPAVSVQAAHSPANEAPASGAARHVPAPDVASPAQGFATPASSSGSGEGASADLTARLEAFGIDLGDIGISGISIGLPGTHKPLFADDDWDRILRGDNLIDALPERERAKLAEKNIVRLVKGSDGQANFQIIDDVAQVIQLAGRRGEFDISQWGVEEDLASTLDRTFQYAIAAGLEALRDAGIPLQRTYLQTTTGSFLPKAWKLPEPLRDETGIVFASAFPGYDNLIRDISRFLADKYAGRTLDQLQVLYQELLSTVQDASLKERLSDWFEAEFERLQDVLPDHGTTRYEFNRKFLFNVLSMGHAQLAQFIGARGPNTQLNAACASSTQAVAVAEDWIRTGRCKRVLVVGADDVTSDAMFEWIGAGFLASGAATTKADVREAALPFDARRHGMIVGMGAVGMVVESVAKTEERGMRPIAKLLATSIANSAFHGSRLDVDHISAAMAALMGKAAARYGFDPAGIAKQTVFVSHETYTPARGGSASAEIHALRATFGDHAKEVVIANTKGFTGHPQGAGVEDAIALKMLQRGQVPPIANFRDPDPELGDLNLSKGGAYDVRYALRLAAGFGSQVAMSLTQLVAREDERVASQPAYDAWLSSISGLPSAKTEVVNRTLRIVDQGPPARKAVQAAATVAPTAPTLTAPAPAPAAMASSPAPPAPRAASAPADAAQPDAEEVLEKVIAVVAQKTGYPTDMLDPELDMEADLGIDTVKQAELFGDLRGMFGVPMREDLQLKDYNTLRKVAGYMAGGAGPVPERAPSGASAGADHTPPDAPAAAGTSGAVADAAGAVPAHDGAEVLQKVIDLVAQKTGYPAEMLEPDLDMEADLGIDTVKQAELFGDLRAMFGVPMREDLQLKDYNTLRKVAQYMAEGPGGQAAPAATQTEEQAQAAPGAGQNAAPPVAAAAQDATRTAAAAAHDAAHAAATPPAPGPTTAAGAATDDASALRRVIDVVAQKTGYPAEMLEPDLDMEADLGIDTVKQAELFGDLRGMFGVPMREDLQLKDYNTLRKVAQYMADAAGAQAAPAVDAAPAAPVPSTPEATATSSVTVPPAPGQQAHAAAPTAVQTSDAAAAPAAARPSDADATAPAAAQATSGPGQATIIRRTPTLRPEPSPGAGPALQRGPVLVIGDADTPILDAFSEEGFQPSFRAEDPVGLLCIATRPGEGADARAGALFEAAKKHQARLGKNAFVAVVTAQDGAHGLERVRDPAMAAVSGLGKALKKELSEATVKVIDVHPDWKKSASAVVDEVLRGGTRTEICFSADGSRYVVELAPAPLADAVPDVAGKHLVVSGGAQGITVEMLAALAPQGPRLLLLGRTQVPEQAAEWAGWDDMRWKQEEQAAMQRMKDANQKVTPVALQKAMAPLRKAAEVQRNLQRLTDLGAQVIYSPVDVTDAEGVAAAVENARQQFGPVTGVVHAAGVEISKDLASKDRDQFDMVFGIKHDGLHALLAATGQDRLEWLVSFGSVAGRFGNIGQTDYSAVNEYLCKAVKHAAAQRRIATAATIAWGPWGEVGMATKGSIMQIMEQSGVSPIPTADGVRHFLNEMAAPGVRECVVAGALGAIDADGQVVDKAWDVEVGRAEAFIAEHAQRFRLVSGIESIREGHLVASLVLDQATQPFARDHAIEGVPYLPGVFGLEAFAEAASLIAPPNTLCTRIEHARFAVPVKQLKGRPVTARVEVELVSAPEEPEAVFQCRLTTRMVGPDGQERGEPRTHFEASLSFGEAPEPTRVDEVPPCTRELAKDGIYPPFFHGPSFQVLRYAGPLEDESVGVAAMPYAAAFSEGEADFHAQPLLLEALFQLCGLRTMQVEGRMSLPAGIDTLELLAPDPPAGEIRLWSAFHGTQEGMRRFDAMACTKDGDVLVRMQGYTMVETGPVPDANAESARDGRSQTAETGSTAPAAAQGDAVPDGQENGSDARDAPRDARRQVQTTLAETVPIPRADVELPQVDGVVFAAVPVADADADPTWFTPEEQEEHAALTVEKRAAEWRAGRLAAKAAILEAADSLRPTDVRIGNEEGGQPYILVKGQRLPACLSISHRDGIAVAAVAERPLGIDVETTERRSNGFHEEAFNAAEKELATDPVGAACVWAAKEAVFKRIGTGLRQALHAWTVQPDGEGGARVDGPDGAFAVRFFDLQGRVLAVTAEAFDPLQTAAA